MISNTTMTEVQQLSAPWGKYESIHLAFTRGFIDLQATEDIFLEKIQGFVMYTETYHETKSSC